MKKFDWLNVKTPRTVDQLRLWSDNPRLNPDENHIQLNDYVEDFVAESADRDNYLELVKSIAEDGFIPADPIVVWQNTENGKFYVAEGNRRISILKLLRQPDKAPKSIRNFVKKQTQKINKRDIAKVLVNVAPSFEDAEWYINQRNSSSSLQKPWSRIQQQRWLSELYEKYDGDIEKITSITKLSQSELEAFIRILKIKELVNEKLVKDKLSYEEFQKASSYKFPISILERFFSNIDVRQRWGIDYSGTNIVIKSNKDSFLNAYAELIKRVVDKDAEIKIDTRTITSNLEGILESLPKISFENAESLEDQFSKDRVKNQPEQTAANDQNQPQDPDYSLLKNNPNRTRLILPIYNLNTDNYRLWGLFNELKVIPIRYNNSIAASMRVFLDLSILLYLESNGLIGDLCKEYPKMDGVKNINLSKRIEFLKPKLNSKAQGILQKLLNNSNELSLDVLNGYVHNNDTHYLNNQFLNKFWDFLFPLFQTLLDIKEENT